MNNNKEDDNNQENDNINEKLNKLTLNDNENSKLLTSQKLIEILSKDERKSIESLVQHKFWDTQPVSKFTDVVNASDNGPIDDSNSLDNVKKNPYPLPDGFEWIELDIFNEDDRTAIYTLLNENYVEDDDNLFRFDYKPEFLIWAITTPGYHKEWHIGVRVTSSKRLVGFITGIPATVSLMGKHIRVAEINFLCIHKKLRSKRLAPVLIKEVTRRINLDGYWQAVYTAGIILPKPITKCRYWHRPLDIKKLVDAKFSNVDNRMTMSRALRIYRVDLDPETSGMRLMVKEDIPSLHKLLNSSLEKYKIHPVFDLEDVEHIFTNRPNVVYTFVKSNDGNITDMTSFYSLPSSVINNPKIATINAAYSYYHVSTTMTHKQLLEISIAYAKANGFDVYNALDLMENSETFEDLKFGKGDGDLYYYLFNWKMPTVCLYPYSN